MVNQKEKIRVSTGFSENTLRDALLDIFRHFGKSLNSSADKQFIADKLNGVARRAEQGKPLWKWRYVHNFVKMKIEPGKEFSDAIVRLSAYADGASMTIAKSNTVTVQAIGNIMPGSFVYGDSRQCANPSCGSWFVSDIWNKHTCSENCSRQYTKWKRKQARENR
jgi:hypothetical protein